MKKYTHITHWQDEEEIYATIMYLDQQVGSFDIIGDWDDNEDIQQSLHDEASRHCYTLVTFQQATMSQLGKKSAESMTKEQRVARAKKAVQAREAKKLKIE